MKFPPVFKKLQDSEHLLLDIDKKWAADFKDSPYYLELPPVRDDVERYSDRFKSWSRPKTKSMFSIPTDLKYFPEELHQVKDPSKKASVKMAKGGLDLDKRLKELEKEESSASKRQKTGGIDDDEEQPETNEYDEEDQEEEDDYVNDFYDDDHDGVGGDESDHGGGDY
ncbi:hypothetical protein BCR33DRAFT_717972 [Rhizoclosmatium globosum]|uniref:DNA-directed RNA polymerase III subunit n=1 Tax=Rhizoclosmatium globosum TaxID=329046 RepID=A0A1Y2C755_9FUNG|nr:hypothetical protein HDU79_008034 [Rhizoclosmatium sp. JEL0117]ORY42776.1 hypothetical protein BCR33DRAFT_717972 [Rhizoclosmatium globosum]|eukprot:ORY42776.1 hypothetical protein BCR33DRAFT_717972 [Rhizoclosmatium globosum]